MSYLMLNAIHKHNYFILYFTFPENFQIYWKQEEVIDCEFIIIASDENCLAWKEIIDAQQKFELGDSMAE